MSNGPLCGMQYARRWTGNIHKYIRIYDYFFQLYYCEIARCSLSYGRNAMNLVEKEATIDRPHWKCAMKHFEFISFFFFSPFFIIGYKWMYKYIVCGCCAVSVRWILYSMVLVVLSISIVVHFHS